MLSSIAIDAIDRNPDQPRQHFDEDALWELAESIEQTGLLQPITVRPAAKGRYMIVAGERRWRAHKLLADNGRLDEPSILCHVKKMTDDQMAIAAIIENLQRTDISPLEEADAFARLVASGMKIEDIAKRCGAPVFRIRWRLQLLNLTPDIRHLFETGNLDRQQAMELSRLLLPNDQHRVLRLINSGRLLGWKSVRQAVDAILENLSQADIFGDAAPAASDEEAATVNAMERKIEAVAAMVGKGWKDGECVIASKVNPDRANMMAAKLNAIQSAIRIMERQLRNTAAQASLLVGSAA